MRGTVSSHNLGSSELKVGSVDLSTEDLVERLGSGEDERVTFDLDRSLTESDEIGSDTDGSGGDEGDGEDALVVGSRGRSGDETGSSKRLDTLGRKGDGGGDQLMAFEARSATTETKKGS
jgi:hypothetical protein